ncbi:type I secretion system permease/ATPase [Brevirhabdus pacifica]|uniref:Type I secretion system permease/ATPase n=3 Tax=Brevirhabdus pacifica TaxID=1267768 RepID=A0A1U7DJI7_9RHOB|nr:type I secretion system permease/ATPase [Brevirhabdus pacifica]APX90053.1 type I secretion system permease/ATPase [Brevirhabdus pacifica]OWU75355.1 peptide ABC transporter ATPase [Loktanella sp. 22II-4b]PJJ82695.1 ATP-binding cassette subfamily C protein [Brevirhabdus pacifica]
MPPTRILDTRPGRAELGRVRWQSAGLFASVFLFSLFVNLLMLTGPLYMLQVYDRVLGSRSEETLIALTLLVAFLYLMMGLLDYARGRLLAGAGARFQATLDRRVFSALLRRATDRPQDKAEATGLRDLEAVQTLMASPALLALYDIPWTPIFLLAIFVFHPWLGFLALAGAGVLILVTLLNQVLTSGARRVAGGAAIHADRMADQIRDEAETVRSLGMRDAAFARWQRLRGRALERTIQASDRSGGFSTLTRTLRLFLQSAMLGLGAYLALDGTITPGAMIAASILMGRALAPIDVALGQWQVVQRALRGWSALGDLLSEVRPEPPRTALPRPAARLQAAALTVLPPGQQTAALRSVTFGVEPGQAMGVIGSSGAGKSTLARAITGVWRPAGGKIRLDGAALDHYDPDVLGGLIGYLPQRVTLFEGTIAQNIARLAEAPDDAAVVAAARAAAAHEMILQLPDGYDTLVSPSGGNLSGGQIQRIGLARALYGDPVLLVLDEPNSNLDNDGSEALNLAIRRKKAEGGAVLIMAHRPAAIQECDVLLVLENGAVRALGPRDEVLSRTVRNHQNIIGNRSAGGVA